MMNEAGQTICLSMIVKDEAPVIARCLDSVLPFLDTWAIVDTGSSDGTQKIIAEQLAEVPGELIERPWVDFAHNRTEALEHARGRADYILLIDADEVLEAPDGFRFPPLRADAYDFDVHYEGITYRRRQLLRAALPWRYHGVLHEYVHCSEARTIGRIDGVRTHVYHDGARARDPLTYKRDALLLEQALLDEPDNARYAFYLAQSYRDAGDPEAAIRAYRRRAGMGGWSEEVWFSLYQIALAEERLERPWPEVMASYLAAYAAMPDRAEPLFRVGVRYLAHGEPQLANLFLARAAALPRPASDRLFVERAVYDYMLPVEHAVAAHYTGDLITAIETSNALLSSDVLPPEAVGQVTRNRRYSLDALHPKPTAHIARARVRILIPAADSGTELEAAVDGALRQDGADFDVTVVGNGTTDALAKRLPTDPRLRILSGTTTAAFAATECEPTDVVVPLPVGGALATPHTAHAIASMFDSSDCSLLHGAHHGRERRPALPPPATETAFRRLAPQLDSSTSMCFRAGLARSAGTTGAEGLWNAAGFTGTRSLDEPLTVDVTIPARRRAESGGTERRARLSTKESRATAPSEPTPTISCLMVTRDRLGLARLALRCFADQTYTRRELVIVSDGDPWYQRALRRCADELDIEQVKIVPAEQGTSLGALRNLSVDAADGEVVCQWDDDDLYAPGRLATQLMGIQRQDARACFLTDHLQYLEREQLAFWIDWTLGGRLTDEQQLFPGTVMMYQDSDFRYPEDGPYSRRGEDSVLVSHLFHTRSVARLAGVGHLYLYRFHGANTFDEAHHRRITSCCAPSAVIQPFADQIREALSYFPVPKPVALFGSEGHVLSVN